MKNIIRAFAFCGIMATAAAGVSAQNTNSAYFTENYNYRYQLNPAYDNYQNFVSMPALGNLNLGLNGSINLTNVFFVRNNKTVLFSSPLVSPAAAMRGMADKNVLHTNLRETILAGGFKAFGGYNSVTLSARTDVAAMVPGSLYELVKYGVANNSYNLDYTGMSAMGYAELAFNHSHEIKALPGLRIGASVKFLVGVASVDARVNRMNLQLGENDWIVNSDADIYVNLGKFQYEQKYNDKYHRDYVSGFNMDGTGSISPNGFGVGFDLGLTYKWGDWTFSAAALDLGFITFSKTKLASTNGLRTFNTDSHIFDPSEMGDSWDSFFGDFQKLYQLDDMGLDGKHTRGLASTLNFGIEYAMPFYRKLTLGFLSSTKILGHYSWSEGRISANVAPVKCFSAGVNFAVSSYGVDFGWILNYSNTGFSIFVGMDNTHCKLAKQGVPLSSNTAVNFGINFPF